METCQFCERSKKSNPCPEYRRDGMGYVRYSTRHCAHFDCYLKAGKRLEDLHAWQVGQFPNKVLKEFGLLETAHKISGKAIDKTAEKPDINDLLKDREFFPL